MSLTIEGVYFIYLENSLEQDLIKRRKLLWNGIRLNEANVMFDECIERED